MSEYFVSVIIIAAILMWWRVTRRIGMILFGLNIISNLINKKPREMVVCIIAVAVLWYFDYNSKVIDHLKAKIKRFF